MQQISFYLKKFERLGLREKIIKDIVIDVIAEIVNVNLSASDIQLVRDQIKIKILGPAKSEIFINKNKIENTIDERLNEKFDTSEVPLKKKVI